MDKPPKPPKYEYEPKFAEFAVPQKMRQRAHSLIKLATKYKRYPKLSDEINYANIDYHNHTSLIKIQYRNSMINLNNFLSQRNPEAYINPDEGLYYFVMIIKSYQVILKRNFDPFLFDLNDIFLIEDNIVIDFMRAKVKEIGPYKHLEQYLNINPLYPLGLALHQVLYRYYLNPRESYLTDAELISDSYSENFDKYNLNQVIRDLFNYQSDGIQCNATIIELIDSKILKHLLQQIKQNSLKRLDLKEQNILKLNLILQIDAEELQKKHIDEKLQIYQRILEACVYYENYSLLEFTLYQVLDTDFCDFLINKIVSLSLSLGQVDIIRMVKSLRKNLRCNYLDIFFEQCELGQIQSVKCLFEEVRTDLKIDDQGTKITAIEQSSMNDNLNIVRYLIEEQQVDPNLENQDKQTPLMLSAQKGSLNVLKYLVEFQQVDLNHKDKENNTALFLCAQQGELKSQITYINKSK